MLRIVCIALLTTFSGLAAAQAPDVQPGMWEYQMEMKMPGMPANIPPQVYKRCLTPQDVAQNKQYADNSGGKNPCTISNMKNSGGRVSYDFICKTERGTMTGNASGSTTPTAIEMESHMKMVPATAGMSEMTQKMRAKRLGNC
ncbi:MAG TPA: DUF3617 family protein [Rhodocyclaceae bacterium]|nr:DUF3617 family protein [Rhodocyclaceae bacterium]